MYLQYSHPHLFITFAKCLEGVVHHQHIHLCWCSVLTSYSTDKFISSAVLGPLQWFFHFGEEIIIAWTHIGWIQCMFQNLPLPEVQEVHDSSSGVMTLCIVMKNDGLLYHQISSHASRSPWKHSCVLWLRATSILIQKCCSSFVNMDLGRSHYPYES